MERGFLLPRRRRRLRPYLDLTAMIDTVFNLLIFFAVASTFVSATSGIGLRLPTAETAQPVPKRVVLTLLPGQPVQVDGAAVPAHQIGAAIDRATDRDLEAQIVVMADSAVSYEELISALDQVRLADYYRIALAATPERQRPARTGAQ